MSMPTHVSLTVRFRLINRSHQEWRCSEGFAIGWQIYDPEAGDFHPRRRMDATR